MRISEKNAEIVRKGYSAFNARDMEGLSKIFHEKSSWHTPGRSNIAGDFKGKKVIFEHFGRYASDTGDSFKANLKELLFNEEGFVVGVHHNVGNRNGRKLDVDCCILFEIKDGMIYSGKEFFYELDEWDEFWS